MKNIVIKNTLLSNNDTSAHHEAVIKDALYSALNVWLQVDSQTVIHMHDNLLDKLLKSYCVHVEIEIINTTCIYAGF